MERPANRPKCKHGGTPGHCKWCAIEDSAIREAIKPLADEWWTMGRDETSLERQLRRAYRLGQDATSSSTPNASGDRPAATAGTVRPDVGFPNQGEMT